MNPRKGSFVIGSDADLTVLNLNLEKTVKADDLESFSDYSLYEGRILKVWPVMTSSEVK
jgi:dihydropyrimidinase